MTRSVTLVAKLTEYDQPLPGSRAWLAEVLESATVSVNTTRSGAPAVFLRVESPTKGEAGTHYWKAIRFKDSNGRSETIAGYFSPFDYGEPSFYSWPFDGTDWADNWAISTPLSLFGINLRPAAIHLLADFGRKCRTLLRYRLRQHDKATDERLRVKLY